MVAENLCLGCMTPSEASGPCPHCGWHSGGEPESHLYLEPGLVLHDQYLVGRVLGHGGFGATYLGWDLNLSMKLAIKEFLPRDFATRVIGQTEVSICAGEASQYFDKGLNDFLDEARVLAKFQQHPGIVSVFNFFKENRTGYMVMEYIEGITLKEYLDRNGGSIAVDQALQILSPVMDALHAVHEAGMLHRDVAPDNIYITSSGQVKLIDFGAARESLSERSKSVILKPGYAPEEQYRSRGKQGPWTDVYATAATLYRAITGQIPPESLDRASEDILERPSALGVSITPQQEQALLQGMAVHHGDRFEDMRAFRAALYGKMVVTKETSDDATDGDAPTRVITPPPPTTRRFTPKMAGLLAAGVMAVVLVGWGVFGGKSATPPSPMIPTGPEVSVDDPSPEAHKPDIRNYINSALHVARKLEKNAKDFEGFERIAQRTRELFEMDPDKFRENMLLTESKGDLLREEQRDLLLDYESELREICVLGASDRADVFEQFVAELGGRLSEVERTRKLERHSERYCANEQVPDTALWIADFPPTS